jgi:hypothetical protein
MGVPNMMAPIQPRDAQNDNRKRIRIACDKCRKKKIKCNGLQPCANCIPTNSECLYKERKNKKRIIDKSKRSNSLKSIDMLDNRLSNLESVITRLTDSLTVMTQGGVGKEILSSLQNTADESNDTTSENEDTNMNYESEENEENNKGIISSTVLRPKSENGSSDGRKMEDRKTSSPTDKGANCSFPTEQYFGVHSIMCIFSNQSLDWIENTLGRDAETLRPIRNLPALFETRIKSFVSRWMDPPIVDAKAKRRILEKPFPEDRQVVLGFIDTYYSRIVSTKVLCPAEDVRPRFEQYYQNLESSKVNGGTRRKRFKQSELLTMTMTLLFAISAKVDEDKTGGNETNESSSSSQSSFKVNTPQSLQNLSDNYLVTLSDTLFDNAIYYYHRISVISDGLDTIQGILLMIIYIESNFVTSHVNYILSSVAIRFAQEIGLHRFETYENLDLQEQARRRKIWWYCQFFDVEICFRLGKPPLINSYDVTTNSDTDIKTFFFKNRHEDLGIDDTPRPKIVSEQLEASTPEQMEYYFKKCDADSYNLVFVSLTKIRANSYNQLFAASAQSKNFEALCKTLESVNSEMFDLVDYIPKNARPYLYNDPRFVILEGLDRKEMEHTLGIQLPFFLHLMLINRIPSIVKGSSDSDKIDRMSKFRSISLDSARTILHLVLRLHKSNCLVLFYNWTVFYPASAFLCVAATILNHPSLPETYNDIKLLINASMNFFSMKERNKFTNQFLTDSKQLTIGLIMKLMLNVIVKFYETKTSTTIFTDDRILQEHLQSARKEYPDIYKDPSEFKIEMKKIILGDSLFHNTSVNSGVDERMAHKLLPSQNLAACSTVISPTTSLSNARDTNFSNGYEDRRSFSPSLNPSVANILHPNEGSNLSNGMPLGNERFASNTKNKYHRHTLPHPQQQRPEQEHLHQSSQAYTPTDSIFGQNDMFTDYMNEDEFSNVLSQMNNMPNFFFDNNVGI